MWEDARLVEGRRRYDVEFAFIRNEPAAVAADVAATRVCKAEYRQISGIPQDVVAVSKVPTIYATFTDLPAASSHFTVAQTIWSSFLWGAVQARLTKARVDGRSVAVGQ
jgi:hypothetical protein